MLVDLISIPLTRGQFAIIEAIDSDLAELKWVASFSAKYANGGNYTARRSTVIEGKKTSRYMHRVILERMVGRELKRSDICDHINGNPLDNRRSNLRLATYSQSAQNVSRNKSNVTGYKGVSWNKRFQKFVVQILVNRKHIFLGYFDDPVEGHEVYKAAAKKYHGEFARFE